MRDGRKLKLSGGDFVLSPLEKYFSRSPIAFIGNKIFALFEEKLARAFRVPFRLNTFQIMTSLYISREILINIKKCSMYNYKSLLARFHILVCHDGLSQQIYLALQD